MFDVPSGEWTFDYDLVIDDGTIVVHAEAPGLVRRQAGAQTRIQMALDAGFGGVSLCALGYDDDACGGAVEPSLPRSAAR